MNDVAETLIQSANQEAVHAGFYATLNGKYPQDFWALLEIVKKAEYSGQQQIKTLADKVRAAGFNEAADQMEIFAKQEYHHGEVIDELLKKYNPPKVDTAGKKIYVCPVCGYEYIGDINAEPDDWTCPLCGQPKSAFKEKSKIQVKAVKFFENGFMTQPFAFGGEEGVEKFDANIKYRSSLQNFVIDNGKEIILVDTGTPEDFPEQVVDEKTQIFLGNKIKNYVDALKDLGYKPEQVSKILFTHKHDDHTGAYKNFPACQKIADGVYYIQAVGHTTGNSIVIVEDGDLNYLIHGDVTYTDEALYENKLSVVFEDKAAARETLNRVREFIRNNKTVYCSTHTPLGYENLEAKKIVDLDNMPAPLPVGEIVSKKATGK